MASNPFGKADPAERPKGKKERKENRNSNAPAMGTKATPHMTMAEEKGGHDKENAKHLQPSQRKIHGQLACNPAFYTGSNHEEPYFLQVHPETKFTFRVNGETAEVNAEPLHDHRGATRLHVRHLAWTVKQFQYPVQDMH